MSTYRAMGLSSKSGHAWRILLLELHRQNQEALSVELQGLALSVKERLSFKLLRDDPSSLLVLYFHGVAETLASGWGPASYWTMSICAPHSIHTTPVEWAMKEANIRPSHIVIFAQSLGTAFSLSLIHHMATQPEPVLFSGVVLVAPFTDVESLTANTYRIAGTIPLLEPVAKFPRRLVWLNTSITTKMAK
ncbi:hypothetical protein F5Y12DRAFT_224016 [Xylaria sp. FL1777]|nr:hypothetical protein F5Y12DRAFT_224016 [Xylaria sp. FL1777]